MKILNFNNFILKPRNPLCALRVSNSTFNTQDSTLGIESPLQDEITFNVNIFGIFGKIILPNVTFRQESFLENYFWSMLCFCRRVGKRAVRPD